MSPKPSLLCAVLALGAATSLAAAAPPHARDATADSMARDLYKEGDAAYAEGRYEDALSAFREAYDLSQRPLLLYNIGNALERLGRFAEAADSLEKFLPHAKPGEKEVLEKRIDNLEKRAVGEEAKHQAERDPPIPRRRAERVAGSEQPADTAPASRAERDESAGSPTLGWVLLAAGGAGLATGAVFGIMALGARRDADASCRSSSGEKLCTEDARDAIDSDRRYSLIADIGFGAGIAAAAAGALLLLTAKDDAPRERRAAKDDRRRERRAAKDDAPRERRPGPSMRAALGPGGGWLGVGGSF